MYTRDQKSSVSLWMECRDMPEDAEDERRDGHDGGGGSARATEEGHHHRGPRRFRSVILLLVFMNSEVICICRDRETERDR